MESHRITLGDRRTFPTGLRRSRFRWPLAATAMGIILGIAEVQGAWIVFDPTSYQQQIVSTAQEVAKFTEMIGNQVKQLKELRDQVSTLQRYVDLFGDPSSVLPESAEALGEDLLREEFGIGLQEIVDTADPVVAMAYDAG